MTYGDSSFLLAIYHRTDFFHAQAIKVAARLQEPLPLTLLGELELFNGIYRCLAAKTIDQNEHDAIFRQISSDEADGILRRKALNQADLFTGARDISKKFTPEISARSLDILHVAAARLLHATAFISFDTKQRQLAQKCSLTILPRTVQTR